MRTAGTLLMLVCATVIVSTTRANSQEKTISGEVVDIVSYMTTGTTADTPSGNEILMASAKGGNPLGVRESSTGKIYIVSMKQADRSANETLLQFVGMKVTVKGRVFSKGSCSVMVVSTIGKSIK
jgi:hypothetical protein